MSTVAARDAHWVTPQNAKGVISRITWMLVVLTLVVIALDFVAKLMTLMFVCLFGLPAALLLLAIVVILWLRLLGDSRRRSQLIMPIACPVLILTVMFAHWPLRVSFATSQASLNQIADQVTAGTSVSLPARAGAFQITWIERREDAAGPIACLWTSEPSRGHVGFVRAPSGSTPQQNPWTHMRMNDRWHYFGED